MVTTSLPPRRVLRPVRLLAILAITFFLSNWIIRGFVSMLSDTPPAPVEEEEYDVIEEETEAPPPPAVLLGEHQYLPSGLLQVNPDGPHPIYELIERAEQRWQNKLDSASTTLGEAVIEYRRRYHRYPPKGFDAWWEYVVENNVKLPDEYDQIQHDLEPFWGLDPTELLDMRDELESKKDSYTIGKDQYGDIKVVNYAFSEGRYDQLIKSSAAVIDLLSEVKENLPDFRIVVSPHDGPNRLTDYAIRSKALKAARNGQYLSRSELPQASKLGWRSACSPSSRALQEPFDLDNPPPRSESKAFIYDHLRSMDPCLNPELFYHHGQFLSHNEGPAPQDTMVPEFSYCSTTIHHNIRIPTPYGWVNDSYDPDWEDKLDERLLWRGTNTGIYFARHTRWQASHRIFLVQSSNDLNGTINILPPTDNRTERVGSGKEYRKSRVNPAMMDVAFAGEPHSCQRGTCEKLAFLYPFRERQNERESGNYKYVIDVDGNGWSGRFKRLITTNSLIFKSTIYPEWFADRVAPWVHYVPIQVDLSDLHDALVFFRGDLHGVDAHEDLARKIAVAGREWSKTFWRREDLIAYFFRLILEYNRLMSLDRRSMTFTY